MHPPLLLLLSRLAVHSPRPATGYPALSIGRLEALRSPAEAGGGAAVEDDESSLERNIAEDVDADGAAVLETTEAGRAALGDRAVVDVRSGDGDARAADAESEAGEGARAGEDIAAISIAVGRTGNLLVVGLDDAEGEVEQGGAGIGNARDAAGGERAAANRVAGRGPGPVSTWGEVSVRFVGRGKWRSTIELATYGLVFTEV